MRKGDPPGADRSDDGHGDSEATGTVVDLYAPAIVALLERGVSPDAVHTLDISVAARILGRGGSGDTPVEDVDAAKLVDADGNPAPATSASVQVRRPKWWKGDRGAFKSFGAGAAELPEMVIGESAMKATLSPEGEGPS